MDINNLEHEVGAWDSVLLDPLNDESLLSNFHQRYKRDHIYTYIGNVLVSINPYKTMEIFSKELITAYRFRGPYQLPPHIYAVAGSAYRFLRDRNEDQVIIVSGESGSGKTEAARFVLRFIAHHQSKANVCCCETGRDSCTCVCVVRKRLFHADVLFEAFGHAKTSRNDNASRFGKYIDVEFDFKGDLLGGIFYNYLLEKSRVTCKSATERNYHIFYQLLSGADIQLLKVLKLQRNINSYLILSGLSKSSLRDDKGDFHRTKSAMEKLGFSSEDIINVFKIVAAVLKLGNIVFLPTNNIDGTEGCSISNDYEMFEVCALLDADNNSLSSSLTSRCLDNMSETVVTDISACEAASARDALCHALYSRLFAYLVKRTNEVIKAKKHVRRRLLGLLDLYGYENLERNGFDQLIINFCNEKLHNVILRSTLCDEQEEYIKEGIEWIPVTYCQNEAICDLIENSKHGVLSILEQESLKLSPRSDEVFLTRLSATLSGHVHFDAKPVAPINFVQNNLPSHCFRLKHFAGPVVYDVRGFLDRNRDMVRKDVSCAMFQSGHPLLKILFPEGNPSRVATRKKPPPTSAAQFKVSMTALLRMLATKQPHYVRCLRPNDMKLPKVFERDLVLRQVTYMGLLETVRVRRQGFCYKLPFTQFLSRYKMLSSTTWPRWRRGSVAEGVSYLIHDLPIPVGEFAFGRTKIFVRSPRTVYELEEFRRDRMHDLAVIIQKTWRGHQSRRMFLCMKKAQITIASAWRISKARKELRILKRKNRVIWAVNVIQRSFIMWKRRQFLRQLSLALTKETESPVCHEWITCHWRLSETSSLLRRLHHKWRCHKYRLQFDQTARNRMREKVTASIIFRDRKASYPRSVSHPFLGDYVRLRHNLQWKRMSADTNDQYVVFADIINKIARSSGKFVPVLFVLSTSSMLMLDQRTLQIKYRVPASEIYRLSLSPFLDGVAVFHVRAPSSPCSDRSPIDSQDYGTAGCLFPSDLSKKKGDFIFQTGHAIEIVTKLFLVIQNAVGRPPEVNICTDFEANFGQQTVMVSFKCLRLPDIPPGQVRIFRRGNKMEILE